MQAFYKYAAWLDIHTLAQVYLHSSTSDKGKPMQNGIAGDRGEGQSLRFTRILKEQHVDYVDMLVSQTGLCEIAQQLEIEYNTQRIHSSRNHAIPNEFENAALDSLSPSL